KSKVLDRHEQLASVVLVAPAARFGDRDHVVHASIKSAEQFHFYRSGPWKLRLQLFNLYPTRYLRARVQLDRLWRSIQSPVDRKSTRLNSSHQIISYAVFC